MNLVKNINDIHNIMRDLILKLFIILKIKWI